MQSFIQRGLKKTLRVNADPAIDSGDSHAPVPFYVTTRGYGVLIDTARYATFYCGESRPKPTTSAEETLGGRIQGIDNAFVIDGEDGIDRGIENGARAGFTLQPRSIKSFEPCLLLHRGHPCGH